MTRMQRESLPLPDQISRHIRRKIHLGTHPRILGKVIYLDHSFGSRHGAAHIAQHTEMRFDADAGKSRRLRSNSGDNRKKIKIRMSAPGVRIRSGGLRLFSPSRQSQRHHVPPWLKEIQVLVSHACMLHRPRQIKPEVVSRLSHLRNSTVGSKPWVAHRKNFVENILLLFPRNYVKPYAEDIGMLAVMFLCW